MGTQVAIKGNQLSYILASGDVVKTLHKAGFATTGSAVEDDNVTDYKPAAGRKFIILSVELVNRHASSNETVTLKKHTVADSNAGTQILKVGAPYLSRFVHYVNIEIAATYYINALVVTDAFVDVVIVGVDTAA